MIATKNWKMIFIYKHFKWLLSNGYEEANGGNRSDLHKKTVYKDCIQSQI